MTPVSALLSFAVVAGLVTIIPGLDTALVLRSAITRGRGYAFATALGINAGVLVWGAGAAVGVSALLTASQMAYTVLRFAGAAYLVWFGVSIVRQSLSRRTATPVTAASPVGGAGKAWARGLVTNLLNPKVGVFYVAMLPQFVPENSPHLLMGLLLALVHNVEGMAWFTLLIFGTHVARRWLAGARAHRVIDRVTGTVLIGFGLRLALSGQ